MIELRSNKFIVPDEIVIVSIVVSLYSYFLYMYTKIPFFLVSYFISSISPLFLMKHISRRGFSIFLILFSIFIIFGILSQGFEVVWNLYNLLHAISAVILGYALFKLKKPLLINRFLFYSYLVFLIFQFIKFGFDADAYNTIFADASRNYLSGILILLVVNVAISCEATNQKHRILDYLLTFLLCIILYGRSGIALSGFLFIYFAFRVYKKTTLILIVIACLFLLLTSYHLVGLIDANTNFSHGLESPRSVFIDEYLHAIFSSPKSFFFGANFEQCCSAIVSFGVNPHNSFILGHSRFGIWHTIFSLGIMIWVLKSKNITYIILLLIIYARYFLDIMGLWTAFDVVLMYLLFSLHSLNKKLSK